MGRKLAKHHKNMLLKESGISARAVIRRGYRTVTVKAELKRSGFSPSQCNVPALLIPLYSPTGEVSGYQTRPDTPRMSKGKLVKYEMPTGSSMTLDVHPSVRDKLKDPAIPLFVTEGVKKGDALASRGLCAVALIGVWNFRGTNEHGGKTVLADWGYIALNRRKVYIVYDSDVMEKKAVHAALVQLKAFLESRGAKVKVIYLPSGDGAAKQGVDDYLVSGHTVDDLLALATTELRAPPKEEKEEGGCPEIVVTHRHLRDITADSVKALEAANHSPTLFMRGTIAARLNGDKAEALTPTSLKGILDRCADFVKVTYEGETTPARPPSDVAPDILTQTSLPFPPLEDVVFSPVFLPGGVLLSQNGYDPHTGLLLQLKGLKTLRADIPVDEALSLLREVFGEFPFVEAAGWAHTLCMVLQPFVRPLIAGATPLYLIDAPARGTGKGLLTEAANLIPFGYVVPTMSQPRDGDELEKRLTSVLLEGRPLVFLDNVTRLDSTHLAAALTAEVWQGRILGKSETVVMPNRALWLASGNNVTLSDELTRRVIPIRMDAGVERPEERTGFKHVPLAEYVRAHRSELVSACLSLIQAWINAGMPKGKASLGRYESWGGVMGGILEVAGVPGFLGGRERLHAEADSETTEWAALTERWWSSYGPRAVTAKDLFEVAKEYRLLLDLWTGKSQLSAMQRLGRALSQKRDRVFGGFRIRNAGKDSVTRNSAYRLEGVGKRTPETPGTPPEREEVPLETLEREAEEAGCFIKETPADSPNTRQTPKARVPSQTTLLPLHRVIRVFRVF